MGWTCISLYEINWSIFDILHVKFDNTSVNHIQYHLKLNLFSFTYPINVLNWLIFILYHILQHIENTYNLITLYIKDIKIHKWDDPWPQLTICIRIFISHVHYDIRSRKWLSYQCGSLKSFRPWIHEDYNS